MNEVLQDVFATVLRLSWQASVVALLILAAQFALKNRVSFRMRYWLWCFVLLRLVIPSFPETDWSIFNYATQSPVLHQRSPTHSEEFAEQVLDSALLGMQESPRVARSAPTVENPVVPAPDRGQQKATTGHQGSARIDLSSICSVVWLLGFVYLSSKLALGMVAFHLRLRRYPAVQNREVRQILDRCAMLLGLRKTPLIVETSAVASPALCGLFRPRILVPSGTIETCGTADLESIFLHELVHLKRRDLWLAWLEALLSAMHWFNPILRFAFKNMEADRELACDETVLSLLQTPSRKHYAETLLKLIDSNSDRNAPALILGASTNRNLIQRRIQMIINFRTPRKATALAIGCVLLIAAIGLTDAQQQKPGSSVRLTTVDTQSPNLSLNEAVEYLRGLGARVSYGEDASSNRVVEISCWNNKRVTDEDLKLLRLFPDLLSVYLGNTDLSDACLPHLAGLAKLQELYLNGMKITDTGLPALKGLKNLHGLALENTGITDSGFKHLLSLTNLSLLGLRETLLTDESAKALAHFPKLTGLSFGGPRTTDQALSQIANLTQLNSLALRSPNMTDQGVEELKRLKNLNGLELDGAKFSGRTLSMMTDFKDLKRLSINGAALQNDDLAPVSGCQKLEELILSQTRLDENCLSHVKDLVNLSALSVTDQTGQGIWISDRGLTWLKGLTNLSFTAFRARFRFTNITDQSCAFLGKLGNLRDLDLRDNNITDEGVANLSRLRRLSYLNLSRSKVTDVGLASLASLTNLWELDLNDLKITDSGLRHLVNMKRMGRLWINNTLVTDDGLKHLKGMTNLSTLWACGTRIRGKGFANLTNCTKLDFLSVMHCKLDQDAFDYFQQLQSVRGLGLYNAGLTDEALVRLSDMKQLTGFSLAWNRVSDVGIARIAGLTNLTELYLNLTDVTDDGLEHLRRMVNLDTLGLQNTRTSDEGLRKIAAHPKIIKLELDGTLVTDAGIRHLQSLSNSLETLLLNNTRITDEGVRQLIPLQQLKTLSLENCLLTDQCVEYLKQMKSLRNLSLLDWMVTQEARAELKAALPELKIVSLPRHEILPPGSGGRQ
ncbi:MAG: hypothetical protein HY735_28620 [Verrucomicrobia bacterium]|nr:hypothetical protein [Verrucomicrobiota bacterium]